jgi:hypothetical protein
MFIVDPAKPATGANRKFFAARYVRLLALIRTVGVTEMRRIIARMRERGQSSFFLNGIRGARFDTATVEEQTARYFFVAVCTQQRRRDGCRLAVRTRGARGRGIAVWSLRLFLRFDSALNPFASGDVW